MSISHQQLFEYVCSKVSNRQYFEQMMCQQQEYFDIQPYKIDKLYSEIARGLYCEIWQKYDVSKELTMNGSVWYENQRKIFIWFIVCYFHLIEAQQPLQTQIDWGLLPAIFFHKNQDFLKFQFHSIIKLKTRILWSPQQDELLLKATEEEGVGRWNQISKLIFLNSQCKVFKSPKHCRQRWLNHLDTKKNKGKWTDEEDYKILHFVNQNGKKWSKIVQILSHTRTEHMIKNRFNSLLTKYRKNKKHKESETIQRILKSLKRQLQIDTGANQSINDFQRNEYCEDDSLLCLQSSKHQKFQSEISFRFSCREKPTQTRDAEKTSAKVKQSIKTLLNGNQQIQGNASIWKSINKFYQKNLIKNKEVSLPVISSLSYYCTESQISESQERIGQQNIQKGLVSQLTEKQQTLDMYGRAKYKRCAVYIVKRRM